MSGDQGKLRVRTENVPSSSHWLFIAVMAAFHLPRHLKGQGAGGKEQEARSRRKGAGGKEQEEGAGGKEQEARNRRQGAGGKEQGAGGR